MVAPSLLRNSVIFGTAEVLNRALPFLLLPILTRVLTPAEYGLVAMFTVLVSIFSALVGVSSHGAVNVAYFRLPRQELPAYVSSVLLVLAATTLFVSLVVAAAAPLLHEWTGLERRWLVVAVVVAALQFVTLVNLVLWQAEERPTAHSAYQLAQAATLAALSLTFVVALRLGWRGQVAAVSVATALFGLGSIVVLRRRGYAMGGAERSYVSDALSFGLPLVPHALAGLVITGIDRFFLTKLVGTDATGLYSTAYQVGLIVSVPAAAFNRAWVPYLFRQLTDGGADGRRRVVQVTYVYFVVILAGAAVLTLLARLALPTLLGEAFRDSADLVGWIAFGYAFNGMYLMVVNQLFYVKRTGALTVVTAVTGVAHALLAFLLIRWRGPEGAAMATAVSFAVMFLTTWILSARACPMPWRLQRDLPGGPKHA